jgi:hypothetical protein
MMFSCLCVYVVCALCCEFFFCMFLEFFQAFYTS